ncbi:Pre-rRNA-processing protein ipi3 [Coemansia sp. RSA 1200]|nr:Pre-rRNA-processing protein ipi3 [Coemansia sp. RSA 1200]
MIWATASGRMLRSWDAHYGAVTSLCSGEGVLVSGGEDAAVHIWMLSQAMDHFAARDAAAMPVVSLMGHTLAVTTLHMAGPGILAGRGRLYTASKDHTCKQWRVRIGHNREDYVGSAELLSTLLYPGIVNDIAVDKGETRVFAATGAGLFQTNLFAYGKSSPQSGTEHAEVGLVALGGTGDVVLSKHNFRYPTTYKNIAALCLNFDGTLLVSASESGDTRVWDTASRQCLRTISDKHLGSGVVQLSSRLAPPQLGGPRASVHTGLLRPETIVEQPVPHKISEISFTPLQRLVQGAESRTSTAFEALIKKKLVDATRDMAQFEASLEDSTPYGGQTSRADIAVLENLRPQNGSSERQIVELQQQMERLQTHHSRTRRLNDELYQSAVTEWLRARQQS